VTTPRSFLDLIAPDHQFTLHQRDNEGDWGLSTAYLINMSCSCGFSTGRAVSMTESGSGYAETLTGEWLDRERLNHLLDQRLDTRPMLLLVADGLES
jgi:hypothetical protein